MKLSKLMAAGGFESLDLDYKSHLDKNDPASWARSIVAFSKGEGGCLAIGADNSGNVAGIPYGEVADDRFLLLLRVGKAHQMMLLRETTFETVYISEKGGGRSAFERRCAL